MLHFDDSKRFVDSLHFYHHASYIVCHTDCSPYNSSYKAYTTSDGLLLVEDKGRLNTLQHLLLLMNE